MLGPSCSHPLAVWRAIGAFAWRKAVLAEKTAQVVNESLVCRRLAPSLPNFLFADRSRQARQNTMQRLRVSTWYSLRRTRRRMAIKHRFFYGTGAMSAARRQLRAA